jgi:hypothetical protein
VNECKPLSGGAERLRGETGQRGADTGARVAAPVHGVVVQVDPTKPMLKAPGTNLLTLKYDKPAFKLRLQFQLASLHHEGQHAQPAPL